VSALGIVATLNVIEDIGFGMVAGGTPVRAIRALAKLKESLRTYREGEQAKAILMERRKIGDPEAHSYLRGLRRGIERSSFR
jgi:hypothetical protein